MYDRTVPLDSSICECILQYSILLPTTFREELIQYLKILSAVLQYTSISTPHLAAPVYDTYAFWTLC